LSSGRAAIAYEMASRYWGRGLAHEACAAMLSHLMEHYEVTSAHAVFKRTNRRSARLLERLGFALVHPETPIEPDELLMARELS
jgi:RimJ/RimL family protein N-acetyltransferase